MNYRLYKLIWKIKRINVKYTLTYWLLSKLNQDTITDYSIDNELCHDYYNEEPEHEDYRMDLD